MITVTVGSESVSMLAESLNISDSIEERTTCDFQVHDKGENDFQKGQPVKIKRDGERIFTGVIESSEKTRVSRKGDFIHTLTCINYHYAADKRLAARVYEQEDAGDIVKDLHEKYLEEEGIYIGTPWWKYEGMTWNEVIESVE